MACVAKSDVAGLSQTSDEIIVAFLTRCRRCWHDASTVIMCLRPSRGQSICPVAGRRASAAVLSRFVIFCRLGPFNRDSVLPYRRNGDFASVTGIYFCAHCAARLVVASSSRGGDGGRARLFEMSGGASYVAEWRFGVGGGAEK